MFAFLICAVYCICAVVTSGFQGRESRGYVGFVKKQCVIPFLAFIALIAAIAIGAVTSWVVLRAGSYSELLSIETGDFATEVEEISYDQIPMLDKDSAEKLGNRKLGELSDMVSQFEILPSYTQINYKGRPVRVTSLAYGDIVKVVYKPLRGPAGLSGHRHGDSGAIPIGSAPGSEKPSGSLAARTSTGPCW